VLQTPSPYLVSCWARTALPLPPRRNAARSGVQSPRAVRGLARVTAVADLRRLDESNVNCVCTSIQLFPNLAFSPIRYEATKSSTRYSPALAGTCTSDGKVTRRCHPSASVRLRQRDNRALGSRAEQRRGKPPRSPSRTWVPALGNGRYALSNSHGGTAFILAVWQGDHSVERGGKFAVVPRPAPSPPPKSVSLLNDPSQRFVESTTAGSMNPRVRFGA
jgi:hypothetical protein